MINLDVKWSDPYQVESKGGYPLWTRHWLIPQQYRSQFFIYWKGNSFKLKDKGYGVKKVDDNWFLTETKLRKEEFSKEIQQQEEVLKKEEPLKPFCIVSETVDVARS